MMIDNWVSQHRNVDIELIDFDNVVFLGTGIGFTTLRETLEKVGIEFQSMVNDSSNMNEFSLIVRFF